MRKFLILLVALACFFSACSDIKREKRDVPFVQIDPDREWMMSFSYSPHSGGSHSLFIFSDGTIAGFFVGLESESFLYTGSTTPYYAAHFIDWINRNELNQYSHVYDKRPGSFSGRSIAVAQGGNVQAVKFSNHWPDDLLYAENWLIKTILRLNNLEIDQLTFDNKKNMIKLLSSSKISGLEEIRDLAEQDGADRPATAQESKPEGMEKPKPEAEERSQ